MPKPPTLSQHLILLTYDYLISIKKPDYRFADQVSQLLYVFAIAAFGFAAYQNPQKGLVLLLVIVGIIVNWFLVLSKKKKSGEGLFRWGLLFAAVGWLIGFQRNIFMAILYALAGILEKQVKFPLEVGFAKDEISFNSFPKKILQWQEVNNVIIKEGLLTIDQKNNKLYQKEIEGYVTDEIETEFNQFCKVCIQRAAFTV